MPVLAQPGSTDAHPVALLQGIPPSRKTLSSSRDASQPPSPTLPVCLPCPGRAGGPGRGIQGRQARFCHPHGRATCFSVCPDGVSAELHILSPPGPLSRPVSCVLTHPPSCVPLHPCALAESHDTQAQGCLCAARTSHWAMTPTEGARLHSHPFPSRSEGPHPASCLPNSTSHTAGNKAGHFDKAAWMSQ